MTTRRAGVIVSGVVTQISNADGLLCGASIDPNVAGPLLIGTINVGAVTVGAIGQLVTFAGNVQVNGTEAVVGQSTFTGPEQFNGLATFAAGITATGAVANDFSGSTGAFKTSTGAITISGSSVNITAGPGQILTLAAGNNIVVSTSISFEGAVNTSGAGVTFDFSGSAGFFKTSTGTVTIGGGTNPISLSGTTLTSLSTLAVAISTTAAAAGITVTANNAAIAGAITFNATNAAATIAFNTPLVTTSGSLTVTGTLTAGSFSSNALATGAIFTPATTETAGLFWYASGSYAITKTDAATYAKSLLIGQNPGATVAATPSGLVYTGIALACQFSVAGGAPTVGSPAYLEVAANDGGADAGKLTMVAPSAVGQVVVLVGYVVGGVAGQLADVELRPSAPIQL